MKKRMLYKRKQDKIKGRGEIKKKKYIGKGNKRGEWTDFSEVIEE